MKPVIALVGRPNVGKSTLYNRFTRTRDAIVADFAGLTRDRHYGTGRLGAREFIVIDTGGFEPEAAAGSIYREMARQTRQAVAEADVVIFVVDAKEGLSAQDYDIAAYLRRLGKPCVLAANKAETAAASRLAADFYELGLGEVHPIAAAHGQGVRALLELALDQLDWPADTQAANSDATDDEHEAEAATDAPTSAKTPQSPLRGLAQDGPIRLALAGRPNAGKSTLINTWLGEERLVAFDMPGTTRDAITVPFERDGRQFELIDTAGLRRKGRVFEAVEKFSVIKTLQAIESANVVLLLIDATEGITDQDAHIAGYILESGRAVVLAVNKWDAVDDYQRQRIEAGIETRLGFLRFANLHFISAAKRHGLGPLWQSIIRAHDAATRKMPTSQLTRVLLESVQFQTPKKVGAYRPKLRYAHQGGMNPPVIVIHGNSLEHLSDAYQRFLEGRFRKAFDLVGTPLRLELKTSHNPYADKKD